MKSFLVSIVGVGLMFTMALGGDNDTRKEVKKLKGTWKLLRFETPPDKNVPEELISKIRFVFTHDKLTITVDDKKVEETTFTLNPGKSPKWIDTVATVGPNKGKTAKGIYELDGDNLKICIGPPGQERPTKFKVVSEPDAKTGVMILKRKER